MNVSAGGDTRHHSSSRRRRYTVPTISLTDFVDFVISAGTPKLSKVRQVKSRGDYQPAFDFWKQLREGIVDFHATHSQNKNDLDHLVNRLANPGKVAHYSDCIRAYKRFLGRKKATWFPPPQGRWRPRPLEVRINPELGLRINGVPHIIKLYFKSEPLSARRVDIILLLLHVVFHQQAQAGTQFGILDVPRGRLYATAAPAQTLLPLLRGEALSFISIWNSI